MGFCCVKPPQCALGCLRMACLLRWTAGAGVRAECQPRGQWGRPSPGDESGCRNPPALWPPRALPLLLLTVLSLPPFPITSCSLFLPPFSVPSTLGGCQTPLGLCSPKVQVPRLHVAVPVSGLSPPPAPSAQAQPEPKPDQARMPGLPPSVCHTQSGRTAVGRAHSCRSRWAWWPPRCCAGTRRVNSGRQLVGECPLLPRCELPTVT